MSILSRIKNKLFSPKKKDPEFFKNSRIQNRSLVSTSAVINFSVLTGDVKIHDHVRLNEVVLAGKITIGKNTSIWGPNTDIHCAHNEVVIGNFCSIARNVSVQEYNHIHDRCSTYFIFQNIFQEKNFLSDTVSSGKIEIGHDVWIGTQCVILSGSKIGTGAVIAANSVVNSEIPPYAIAAGSPAKVLKYRFDQEIIDKLLKLEWWFWPHEKIRKNKDLFEGKLTLEKLNNVK